jgi:hypothetical protein
VDVDATVAGVGSGGICALAACCVVGNVFSLAAVASFDSGCSWMYCCENRYIESNGVWWDREYGVARAVKERKSCAPAAVYRYCTRRQIVCTSFSVAQRVIALRTANSQQP